MQAISRGLYTPVVSLTGSVSLYLPPGDDDGRVFAGDMNGDGRNDLIVEKRGIIPTWQAFAPPGLRFASFLMDFSTRSPVVGDVDGDRRADLVNYEPPFLGVYGYEKKRYELGGWPEGQEPSAAFDIDGDGRDEVFSCHSALANRDFYDKRGMLKPECSPKLGDKRALKAWQAQMCLPTGGLYFAKSGKFVRLQFPKADFRRNIFTGSSGEIGFGDPDGDGEKLVYVMPSLGSMLLAFDRNGKLRYYEEFGEAGLSINMLKRGRKDYLVLQLEKKLVIFP
jgi:hypothetical protein